MYLIRTIIEKYYPNNNNTPLESMDSKKEIDATSYFNMPEVVDYILQLKDNGNTNNEFLIKEGYALLKIKSLEDLEKQKRILERIKNEKVLASWALENTK